jgi:hypothetical protein
LAAPEARVFLSLGSCTADGQPKNNPYKLASFLSFFLIFLSFGFMRDS